MKIAGIALIIMLAPTMALAHGSNLSFTAASDEYTVDVGYDPVVFETGSSARFDFLLWKGEVNTGESVSFDHVWVRLIRDRTAVLAIGVAKQHVGPTTLLYVFDTEGVYELETSYRDEDGNIIAKASFPFTVLKSTTDARWKEYGLYALVFVLGMVIGAVFLRVFKVVV